MNGYKYSSSSTCLVHISSCLCLLLSPATLARCTRFSSHTCRLHVCPTIAPAPCSFIQVHPHIINSTTVWALLSGVPAQNSHHKNPSDFTIQKLPMAKGSWKLLLAHCYFDFSADVHTPAHVGNPSVVSVASPRCAHRSGSWEFLGSPS